MKRNPTERLREAERLRRQYAREAEATARLESERRAYSDGRRKGAAEARSEPIRLPSGFVEEVLREMARLFARQAMERASGDLPYPVVATVAERVWGEMRWNAQGLDHMAEMFVQREFERGDVRIDVYLPSMQASNVVDRRHLEMLPNSRRA